jgi:hypothetical protein
LIVIVIVIIVVIIFVFIIIITIVVLPIIIIIIIIIMSSSSSSLFLLLLQVVLLDLEVLSEISSNPAGLGAAQEQTGEEGVMKLQLPSSVQHIVESRQGLNQYFTHFMVELMVIFKKERQLLEDRGSFIIR